MTAVDIYRNRPRSLFGRMEPLSREFDRMLIDMDRAMDSLKADTGFEFVPACDVEEDKDEYHFLMDVPGVEQDDIDIEVNGNTIRITGERKHESKDSSRGQYHVERSYGKFSRSFELPSGIKESEIEANYDNGQLSLTIPKSKEKQSKRISIKSGKQGSAPKLKGKNKSKDD